MLIWKHIHYFLQNFAKTICSALTGGLFIQAPASKLKMEYKRLARLSHAFAWLADFSLIYLGGDLKRKERLSARLADGMSYLYMAMAALRYAQQQGETPDHYLHAKWATSYCFYHAQKSMISFCDNFPSRPLGFLFQLLAFPLGQSMRYPNDRLDHQLARMMCQNNVYRQTLTSSVYLSGDANQPVDKMEQTLQAIIQNEDLYYKVGDLKRFKFGHLQDKLAEKVQQNKMTQEEMDTLVNVEKMRWDAIQVDEFSFDSMKKKTFNSLTNEQKTPFD